MIPKMRPEGLPDRPITIIGEAMGREELSSGKPFRGPVGMLLTKLLTSAGIDRSSCYLTNVVKDHPPKNDISKYINFSTKYPNPTEELLEHVDYLHSELSRNSSNVFIPMGNLALWAICGKTSITKWRGSVIPGHDKFKDRKCIPTMHPGYAMDYRGQPEYQFVIVNDLMKAKKESLVPEIVEFPRKLKVRPS